METVVIREIQRADNIQMGSIIRGVLEEMGVPKVGTTVADKVLDCLYEHYDIPNASYFVVEEKGRIIGGAGVIQLDNYEGKVCELQKMYLLDGARGKGIGSKMLKLCLERARQLGFEHCYLETMPYMETAQKLYLKNGFEHLDGPIGNTGHYGCGVWMLKKL